MAKSFHELSPKAQTSILVLLCALTTGGAWQLLIGPNARRSRRRGRIWRRSKPT